MAFNEFMMRFYTSGEFPDVKSAVERALHAYTGTRDVLAEAGDTARLMIFTKRLADCLRVESQRFEQEFLADIADDVELQRKLFANK
jgi:hypothetical protein